MFDFLDKTIACQGKIGEGFPASVFNLSSGVYFFLQPSVFYLLPLTFFYKGA